MRIRAIAALAVILAGLIGVYLVSRRAETVPPPKPPAFLWSVRMNDLARMVIVLPREGGSEAWVRHEDRLWYFDTPGGPQVNMQRWGGGVPLLLSGPAADRPIAMAATDEELDLYGFKTPRMAIELTLADQTVIDVEVGDDTPDGRAYYIKLASSRDVFAVDQSWVGVLKRLVREPPYPESDTE